MTFPQPPSAAFMINMTLGKAAAAKVEGIEARVRASMAAVKHGNWLSTDDDEMFRAGVGGAMMSFGVDSDEYKQILRTVNAIRRAATIISAAAQGLSISELTDDGPEPYLPLLQWWKEA